MAPRIESFFIISVTILLIIFVFLYFYQKSGYKKLRKGNIIAADASKSIYSIDSGDDDAEDIVTEWTEQLQIIRAQLDLMFQLSPVFIACFDFVRNYFSLSENGYEQLNLDRFDLENGDDIDQNMFEQLIHPDDMSLYEEIKSCKDIRLQEISESPYVLRLKRGNDYGQYFIKIKPIYDINGNSVALILAFICAEIQP